MGWLYDAGIVICYVRSRLWQNSIFIITLLLYISFYNTFSCCSLLLSLKSSLSLSLFSLSLSLSLSLTPLSLFLASQVEREARVDDGITVLR